MGVDVEFYAMIGVNKGYDFVRGYKSKTDSDYLWDIEEEGYMDYFKHIVFMDYLPDDYKVVSDCMGSEYAYIGKVLEETDDLYNGVDVTIDLQKFQTLQQEVYTNLKSQGLDIELEDVKLHTFTHFH